MAAAQPAPGAGRLRGSGMLSCPGLTQNNRLSSKKHPAGGGGDARGWGGPGTIPRLPSLRVVLGSQW